jgi:hypothetical protein
MRKLGHCFKHYLIEKYVDSHFEFRHPTLIVTFDFVDQNLMEYSLADSERFHLMWCTSINDILQYIPAHNGFL